MRAYKGIVKDGYVVLAEGVDLPEGTIVTVTVGETELMRAKLRRVLRQNNRKRVKVRLRPLPEPVLLAEIQS